MEATISLTLQRNCIRPRSKTCSGTWLMFLLPVAVISANSAAARSTLAINLLLAVIYLLLQVYFNKTLYVSRRLNFYCCCIISCLNIYYFKLGTPMSLLFGVLSSYCYYTSLTFLLNAMPYSFTFGEANIIVQGGLLYLHSFLLLLSTNVTVTDDTDIASVIIQIGFFGLLLIGIGAYNLKILQTTTGFYLWTGGVCCVFIIPVLEYLLKLNPVVWILVVLVDSIHRIGVLCVWAVCFCTATFALSHHTSNKQEVSTSTRKYFHILLVFVFVSGVLYDYLLIYLAGSIVLAIFIYLEMLRLLQIEPLAKFLNEGFATFADEKDGGNVALTPLYLFIGCLLPLWLLPTQNTFILAKLSGVLAVGVGDTGASVVGSRFGKLKWPNSEKTVEGTLGCILAQVMFLLLLFVTTELNIFNVYVLVGVLVTSFTEAITDQVDNLVLPLVAFIILIWAS